MGQVTFYTPSISINGERSLKGASCFIEQRGTENRPVPAEDKINPTISRFSWRFISWDIYPVMYVFLFQIVRPQSALVVVDVQNDFISGSLGNIILYFISGSLLPMQYHLIFCLGVPRQYLILFITGPLPRYKYHLIFYQGVPRHINLYFSLWVSRHYHRKVC